LKKVTSSKIFLEYKMTYKMTTLQQLKEIALKNPEVKRCYDNETLTINDVEAIEIKKTSKPE
jgi:hypothetical protein